MSKCSTSGRPASVDVVEHQAAVRGRLDRMNARTDKIYAGLGLGLFVVALEILAKGAHVHVEDRNVEFLVAVLLGDGGFLEGVHAADARSSTRWSHLLQVPGAHALHEGDPGRLLCRPPAGSGAPSVGPEAAQHPFELHGGDHVGMIGVHVRGEGGGIVKALKPGARITDPTLRFILPRAAARNSPRPDRAEFFAGPALALGEVKAVVRINARTSSGTAWAYWTYVARRLARPSLYSSSTRLGHFLAQSPQAMHLSASM